MTCKCAWADGERAPPRLPSPDARPKAKHAGERDVPGAASDHYTCGTGGIPHEDWKKLGAVLREIDFDGMGVFEILPRQPLQTAPLAKRFLGGVFGA